MFVGYPMNQFKMHGDYRVSGTMTLVFFSPCLRNLHQKRSNTSC